MTVEMTEAPAPLDSLEDLLTATEALAGDLGADQVTHAVGALRHHLADTTVRVAVLGGARTGRSTLCAQLTGTRPPAAYELIDTPPIDGTLEDLAAAIVQTADSDIVVVAVSASAALSRTETGFLTTDVLPHRLAPVIVVLTHLDQVDEPDRVLRATRRQAEALDPRLTVLPGPGREPDPERLAAISAAIADIGEPAVTRERRHQIAVRLAAEIDVLIGLAAAAMARQADHAAALAAIDDQERVLRGLHTALERRHRRARDRLYGQIDDEQDAIVTALTRDLTAATDPVAWWTTELADRLGRLLLDIGGRLDDILAERTTDGDQWLERELRTQIGIDDWAGDTDSKQLPAAAVTAAPTPAPPADARHKLLRDLLRALRPVLPVMLQASKAFRGKALVEVLVEPAIDYVDAHMDKQALGSHRAELIRHLPAVVRRHLDAYQQAVADALAGRERAELHRLDGRWRDWRAVQLAAAGPEAPDAAGPADRARTLSRQLRLLDPTIKGTDQ